MKKKCFVEKYQQQLLKIIHESKKENDKIMVDQATI
jgi:hypothetical protein